MPKINQTTRTAKGSGRLTEHRVTKKQYKPNFDIQCLKSRFLEIEGSHPYQILLKRNKHKTLLITIKRAKNSSLEYITFNIETWIKLREEIDKMYKEVRKKKKIIYSNVGGLIMNKRLVFDTKLLKKHKKEIRMVDGEKEICCFEHMGEECGLRKKENKCPKA